MRRLRNSSLLMVLVLFCISIVLFGGCGKKEQEKISEEYSGETYPENGLPKDKEVTLSMIFPVQGYGKDYFDYAVKTFQEKFKNVKINVRYIEEGGNTYRQIINAAIQSGNDKEMYDWIYSLSPETLYIQEGKVEQQDDLWERTLYDNPEVKVKDALLISKESAFAYNGHMWIVPSNLNIYGLYYNKKWFRDHGISDKPKDWNEFMAICEKIKALGVYPMVMAGKHASSYFNYGWGTIPYTIGGDEYRENEYHYRPDIYNSKPYVNMLKKLEEFSKKGYLHQGTASFDHTQSQMEFVQGKAALITNGTWIANEMRGVVPSDFEWGFMVFPGNDLPEQTQVILLATGGAGYIWKNRPELNKKWTKEFNLWLLNLEVQKRFAQSGGVPTRKDFDETETNGVSASVIEALRAIRRTDVRILDNKPRAKVVANSEMAKMSKVRGDGFISIITGRKSAEEVAEAVNSQYMKGLALDKEQ